MKKIQIGVMGSAADLNYSEEAENFAKELGRLIGKSGNILVYGAEKGYSSLSTTTAMAASEAGGITVGVTGGKDKNIWGDFKPTVLIPCGLDIGGGREFTLVLACDVIIAISGGSGTLTEIAIAYQANIPIITVDTFGGWSEQLSGKFIDDRKRLVCESAKTPEEALKKALKVVEKRKLKSNSKEE